MPALSHPLFARLYHLISPQMEVAGSADHRREALEGLEGRVIELGAGNGLNFGHYPSSVTEVVAVEPDPYLRHKAEEAARHAPVSVRVLEGDASVLPAGDASFDGAVASLVLCSVPDPAGALAELHRVLRPGGDLRFYEHVRAEQPSSARLQDAVAPLWALAAGGCRPNRDTVSAIEAAGFFVEAHRRFRFEPSLLARPVAPHVIGRARRP